MWEKTHVFAFGWIINSNMQSCREIHLWNFENIFVLLDKFFCLFLNENLWLLNFLSVTFLAFGRLYLGILDFKSEQCFWVLDFCIFNLRGPLWFVCLAYTLPSNISYRVLFSFYRTPEDRTKLAVNLHSWKRIYLKIIGLLLLSFWYTTFIFLLLRCIISLGGEKIFRFLLFELVLRVFFAFIFWCFLKCYPL